MRHAAARFFALTAASALAVASAAEPPVAVPPEPAGMTPLFNGRDLAGWDGDPRLWSVRDGVIHGETTVEQPAAGNTFLICEGDPVRDFELRLSFRCTATNNSGIQYRSVRVDEASARNRWVVRGYQHELRNEERFPNVPGFIYDEGGLAGGRGRICMVGEKAIWPADGPKQVQATLITPDEFEALAKVDEWNDVVIRAEGSRIRHWLNGRLILDFVDEHPKALAEGVIALQLHAGKPMWAEFRDIRLKRL
ncbi:MAG: DUF1080 domain-containing protein [Planctomycetia bacterium]|nr:DUF1080 domain-containing protein [Planctomycetia bacterium]